MMGFFDWLVNKTVSEEAQEILMDNYLATEHISRLEDFERALDAEFVTDDQELKARLKCFQDRAWEDAQAAKAALLERGYHFDLDVEDWVKDEEEVEEEIEECSEEEETEEEPQSFWQRLFG